MVQPTRVCSFTDLRQPWHPQGAAPRHTNSSIAEPGRRTESLCTLHYCPPPRAANTITEQHPTALSAVLSSRYVSTPCSIISHLLGALSASSRKGNSGFLQSVAAPHYFSPCLGCPQSKVGTHAPLDALGKACFNP